MPNNGNSNNMNYYNLNYVINHIIEHTDNKNCKIVEDTFRRYFEIDSSSNTRLLDEVYQSLMWVAEKTKDYNYVNIAAQCYLSDDVISLSEKYKGNVLTEVFSNVAGTVEDYLNIDLVRKYAKWVSNGWIHKLLNFVSEFPENGNLKLEKDIYYILGVDVKNLEIFDELAAKVNRKKMPLEKKIEMLSILRDIVNSKIEKYATDLLNNRTDNIKKIVENELGIKLPNSTYSIRCGVKLLKDSKKDPNIQFLLEKINKYKNIKKWLFEDKVTKSVIGELKNNGFDPEIYVANGKLIAQKRTSGMFSENPVETFKRLVIKIVGSKKNSMLPKVSIYKNSPGQIFKEIKNDYFSAINNQDKESMKRTLETLKILIEKAYENRKVPENVFNVLNNIYGLNFVLNNGGVFTYRGAKVYVKVWKRKIPEDLYDAEELWCCLFLPQGEKNEIPLIIIDPKITILQFNVQGLDSPVSIAFLYAGKVGNEPALLIDTWEGGGLVYSALGQEKMKDFALDSMKKFARKVGAKKLLIFANPKYSRAREFVNYLKDKNFKPKEVYFESIDSDDSVLRFYSKGNEHHYTDAFGTKPIEGKLQAFVFDLKLFS